ncbi:hypothetical protein-transmembrane prediction [Rhodopirellula baltica SH 1]|uniref:Uncharacterized protein n=1 Tax=Rhodopirellula baltica (strain DSM 10527 / NCIMB 13988 / SH1) TaxID=243090 RepID=Q7UXY3_RHOBA|nr:hypothetical protein-transmembrane prediction [Rhodopirellula baltica SH 1]
MLNEQRFAIDNFVELFGSRDTALGPQGTTLLFGSFDRTRMSQLLLLQLQVVFFELPTLFDPVLLTGDFFVQVIELIQWIGSHRHRTFAATVLRFAGTVVVPTISIAVAFVAAILLGVFPLRASIRFAVVVLVGILVLVGFIAVRVIVVLVGLIGELVIVAVLECLQGIVRCINRFEIERFDSFGERLPFALTLAAFLLQFGQATHAGLQCFVAVTENTNALG